MDGINFFYQGSGIKILGKIGLRDQNNGKKIGINGSLIYHVTTLLDWRTRSTKSTRFNFKFFRVFSKNIQPGNLHCTIFASKISTVIFIREGLALSRSQSD